jgi:hypothetical protein
MGDTLNGPRGCGHRETNLKSAPSSARGNGRDPEGELFAVAQAAHFEAHDPESALHAWDAYLPRIPWSGSLALQARCSE